MTEYPEPPQVNFEDLPRSNSLRETYHTLWPHLHELGRVFQADLAQKIEGQQDNYSIGSLRRVILPQIADVLSDADIIEVVSAESKRRNKKEYVEWVLKE